MPIAVAVWSLRLVPDEPQQIVLPHDVVITNVALGDEIADQGSRTTVKLLYRNLVNVGDDDDDEDEDEQQGQLDGTVLCSLTPGMIEQASINVTLEGDEIYGFEAVGKNTVYLTGNYVDQNPDQVPYNDESEDDEDDFDLRDVSSDVEIDPLEMDVIEEDDDDEEDDSHRFEEIPDGPPVLTGSKRPRESDVSLVSEKPSKSEKLSKAEKKAAKKQKGTNGEAVPVSSEKAEEATQKDKKEKKEAKAASATKELAGGLKVTDVTFGEGPQAKPGQRLEMRYIGKLNNGKTFDSNTKGKPFSFVLGKGEVIQGWDQGLKGMQAGGERLLVIPPQLAYGKKKMSGIPPNSTLTFEVKLLSIK